MNVNSLMSKKYAWNETITEIFNRWHLYNFTTSCNYKYSYIINEYSDAHANKGQIKGTLFFIFFQLAQQITWSWIINTGNYFTIVYKKMCLRKQMPQSIELWKEWDIMMISELNK